MKQVFKLGDKKRYKHVVAKEDIAAFESGTVHAVYSTFALARDAEWACRLFVLEMKDEEEEGIGTFVNVRHVSPAMVGDTVEFIASIKSLRGNEIVCTYEAYCGERKIAEGEQGQKVLPKEKLKSIFGRYSQA